MSPSVRKMEDEIVILSDDEIEPKKAKLAPEENGIASMKKTARKKMSSFTPKLTPTEIVTLEEEPKPST